MDQYKPYRDVPLLSALAHIGYQGFKKSRDGWAGKCPFHNPKTNETAFRFTDDGIFHCFGCSAKGKGSIDLVIGLKAARTVTEAVELLKPLVGYLPPPEQQSPRTAQTIASQATPKAKFNPASYQKFALWPSPWLTDRGITRETCERYGVFHYRNDSRKSVYNDSVLIPFRNFETGAVDGYMSRNTGEVTSDKPKYKIPAGLEKSKYLFGAYELKKERPVKVVLLVESPFAAVKLHQLGFCAVAAYGWSLSETQIEILALVARGCLFLPDANKYQEAAVALPKLAQKMWVRYPVLPDTVQDPEDLSRDQIRQLLL